MAIPRRVREQGDEAERLAQQQLKDQDPQGHGETPTETPAEPGSGNEPSPPTDPAAQSQPNEPAPSGEQPAEPATDWEKRFKGLKQRHDQVVHELREENHNLRSQNEALNQRLERLEQQVANQPAPASPGADQGQGGSTTPAQGNVEVSDVLDVLSPEEREEFSPQFLKVLARVADAAASKKLANQQPPSFEAERQRLERLEQDVTRTREQQFWDEIEEEIPNLSEINADARFQQWALEYDPLLGMVRDDAIKQARDNLNASRIAAIYHQFEKEVGDSPGGSAGSAQPRNDPRASLQEPEGAGAGSQVPTDNQPWFSVKWINKFYEDAAHGKYSREEAEKIERQIWDAKENGRVY